ncbi:MAG: fatty acid desaturase [Rhodobacteraceae bacterium CG17_big_fil_post_rev_8_21_14_2_50_65_11]|nr:MAG: fatty acid desaturase [Rhodobacteraceae bacterium CG17_big_fil_post_rev_8_21_14_2_50_65_11]
MRVEWPTLLLIVVCYGLWGIGMFWLPPIWLPLAIGVTMLAIVLQSSLQHEVIHGHPFPGRRGAALVYASLNLCIPYGRFRDTHLSHHLDSTLTDPYDDPESNYLDPAVWRRLASPLRAVMQINNTLLGRMLLGPLIGQLRFMADDLRQIRAGNRRVLLSWLEHIAALAAILWIVALSPMPVWAYLVAAYAALSILKIRTFLEHRAHETARGRTVIIEDRGLLAFLFLNNNLHVVHHMHPRTPWYRLPQLYLANRETYLARNEGYRFRSYGEIFRRYLLSAKDPVPHPLWPRD